MINLPVRLHQIRWLGIVRRKLPRVGRKRRKRRGQRRWKRKHYRRLGQTHFGQQDQHAEQDDHTQFCEMLGVFAHCDFRYDKTVD